MFFAFPMSKMDPLYEGFLIVLAEIWGRDAPSPLYLAVEKREYEIASLILSTFKSPASFGPSKRTALHAAVKNNSPGKPFFTLFVTLPALIIKYIYIPFHF